MELSAQAKAGRLTREHFDWLMENPDRFDRNLGRFGRIHQIEVNYDLGLPGLIKAAKQNDVAPDFNPTNFPLEGKGVRTVRLELYEFDRTVTGHEGWAIIDADGYQVEGPAELCAFIALNRMAQLRRPIVAWKARWRNPRGEVYAPCAQQDGDEGPCLGFALFELNFDPSWCVLVSRKPDLGQ